jgi:hypothetical protein
MELNEKWERILQKVLKELADVARGKANIHEAALRFVILRQCLEIQQRLDEIEGKIDAMGK